MKKIIIILCLSFLLCANSVLADTVIANAIKQEHPDLIDSIFFLKVAILVKTELISNSKKICFGPMPRNVYDIEEYHNGTATMIDPKGYLALSSHSLGPQYIIKNYCSQVKLTSPYSLLKKIIVLYTLWNGKTKYFGKYELIAKNKECICGDTEFISSTLHEGKNIITFLEEDSKNDIAIIKVPGNNHPFIPISIVAPSENQKLSSFGYKDSSILFYSGRLQKITKNDKTISTNNYLGLKYLNKDGFIKTSMPVRHGNSGGAVINDDFELVGIIVGITYTEININNEEYVMINSSYASKTSNVSKLLKKAKKYYQENFNPE